VVREGAARRRLAVIWIAAALVAVAFIAGCAYAVAHIELPPLTNAEGRRAWAFVAIWVGCMVFTGFAAVAVYLVSGNARYSLVLGLAAHVQLFVGLGAFAFVLGRRMRFSGSKSGLTIDDSAEAAAEGAQIATDAAQAATEELKP
jgi:hypothetical protein